jgi:lysozyme
MSEILKVVDISRHNGEIDFSKMVKAGVVGVAIRATVGDYYTDPRFYHNWQSAGDQGLYRTAYHVVRPGCSARLQMDRFFEVLGERRPQFGRYGWVMDCEVTDHKKKDVITDCIWYAVIEASKHAGKAAFIYTRMSYWNHVVNPTPNWKQWPLWVARYTAAMAPWFASEAAYLQPREGEWKDWAVWQWSADGNHQGPAHGCASPHVDLNRAKAELFNNPPPAPPVEEEEEKEEALTLIKTKGMWKVDRYYIYPRRA